jgi:NAD-dependent SIR2 family protein deacetylase
MIRTTNLRFGGNWTPSSPEVLDTPVADQLAATVGLLHGRSWTCLTGAGISTDSGIPDYRGPDSPRATPMLYQDFVGSASNRQRYWARSYLGWQATAAAYPNAGHDALAELADRGVNGVITQNVDGLHIAAGSDPVVELHGRLADVACLNCGQRTRRGDYQDRLAALNPGVVGELSQHPEMLPDGDAIVDNWSGFKVAPCANCGGVLKPDVIFFGESVPRDRVEASYRLVDAADALVVAGSSLAVMSGLRFVRHVRRTENGAKPVIIINRGATRGDELASVKIDADTSAVLTALAREL